MSDRDKELDELLKPLAKLNPSTKQLARWQSLVQAAPSFNWKQHLVQVAAAACIGFILGAWFFQNHQQEQAVTDNFDASATIEMVYSKSE